MTNDSRAYLFPPLRVSVSALLQFFDEPNRECAGHASAIAAVAGEDLGAALFCHFIESEGGQTEILSARCTQRTKQGVRLDRWIRVYWQGETVLYQTEIKNWSAHAIGGRALALGASESDLVEYRMERWAQEWDGKTLKKKQVAKVLTPMRSPLTDISVEPLVCFWTSLHPQGNAYPFFQIRLHCEKFKRLSVFSMSSYLRSLRIEKLDLQMPNAARRLELLAGMFSSAI